MHNVEIRVFPIARKTVDRGQTRQWLDHIGAKDYEPPYDELSEADALIGLAAKRCYMSFSPGLNPNVTKVREDWTAYLDNILASGHGSVLAHASWTWAIEGLSRVATGELNRHSAGTAISEGSMRYIRFRDIPWWMPLSIRESPDDDPELAHKKAVTREVFAKAFTQMEENYTFLADLWGLDDPDAKFKHKKEITSCIRRIIGMGTATGGVWTFNCRALRHIMALRTEPAAEEEIAFVMSMIAKTMVEEEFRLFGDFTQVPGGAWVPKYKKV